MKIPCIGDGGEYLSVQKDAAVWVCRSCGDIEVIAVRPFTYGLPNVNGGKEA